MKRKKAPSPREGVWGWVLDRQQTWNFWLQKFAGSDLTPTGDAGPPVLAVEHGA